MAVAFRDTADRFVGGEGAEIAKMRDSPSIQERTVKQLRKWFAESPMRHFVSAKRL